MTTLGNTSINDEYRDMLTFMDLKFLKKKKTNKQTEFVYYLISQQIQKFIC